MYDVERFTDFSPLGYTPMRMDVHDHWLSEEEFIAQPFIFYREAWEKGFLGEYLEREARFQALFEILGAGGVSEVGRTGTLRAVRPASRRLRQIVLASTRDWRFMDLYLHAYATRAIGSFDQCVLLLVQGEHHVPAVLDAVHAAGLHGNT